MKSKIKHVLMTGVVGISLAVVAYAFGGEAEHKHDEQGSHTKEMSHEGHGGAGIHKSAVEGHQFTYELIDIMAKMEGQEGVDMSEVKSHHLMVFITGPDGQVMSGAKVGFKVVGPDGSEQKAMAMAMAGGYGADVDLKDSGAYEISTKAVAGDKTLIDKFSYEVK
jgi:hypothetical protein